MMLYNRKYYGILMFPNHTQNSMCQNFMCMHVTNTILIMSTHTHNITISTLLSSHAPLIYKQDPTPNLSFPIYQLIQHITKKNNNSQLVKEFALFTS